MSQTLAGQHPYPTQEIRVQTYPGELGSLYTSPLGWLGETWPSEQLTYLGFYLARLGCKTVLVESHYIDKDYLLDLSIYYSRSLCNYDNHCSRIHFFRESFDQAAWEALLTQANRGERETALQFLNKGYIGFTVRRPLQRSPVGRTVLPPLPEGSSYFGAVRRYVVHLAGFELSVEGLAFQQQDQGVSACATTALWSALHCAASKEGLPSLAPAQITEAASRYYMAGGRSLPSEGLNIQQICEATRAADLSPVVISGVDPVQDVAQLHGYLRSGFAPVLAIQPFEPQAPPNQEPAPKHAICAVGLKLREVSSQADLTLKFRDGASETCGIYVHDDRLGPYAIADIHNWTWKDKIRTSLLIKWADGGQKETSILEAIVVPLPSKVRLTIAKMRQLAVPLAHACGQLLSEFGNNITFVCRYWLANDYRNAAFGFGLSDQGIYQLNGKTVLSRYVGAIEISAPQGPLFDLLLDTTEAQPIARAIVKRHTLPETRNEAVAAIASKLATSFIV